MVWYVDISYAEWEHTVALQSRAVDGYPPLVYVEMLTNFATLEHGAWKLKTKTCSRNTDSAEGDSVKITQTDVS